MARELSRPLRLFIASQPTRGVDVGSIEFLHKRIVAERDDGTPVMIVSTELDEVIELADRIAVLYKGKLVGIVPAGTGRDVLGLMMAGVTPARGRMPSNTTSTEPPPGRQAPREATMTDKTAHSGPPCEQAEAPRYPAPACWQPSIVPAVCPERRFRTAPASVLRKIFTGNGMVSVLAVLLALIIGGLLIASTDTQVLNHRRLPLRPARATS